VNQVDWKTRRGEGAAAMSSAPSDHLGWDFAGDRGALAKGSRGSPKGTPVYGMVNIPGRGPPSQST